VKKSKKEEKGLYVEETFITSADLEKESEKKVKRKLK